LDLEKTMRLFNDAHSYATPANAIKALEQALAKVGLTTAQVRWMVAVNDRGRFSPVVSMGQETRLLQLVNFNVCVTN
jgi:hypothetical protein